MTRILLLGLMGTGKTTVGRRLAGHLGCAYLDNDDLVKHAEGAALDELRRRTSGDALHAAESAALHDALMATPPVVAGVAAWAVVPEENRALMRASDAFLVWLRATPEVLVARIGDDTRRPWLRPDPLAVLTRMAAERDPLFAEVADLVVDVGAADADPVAQTIVRTMAAEFKNQPQAR